MASATFECQSNLGQFQFTIELRPGESVDEQFLITRAIEHVNEKAKTRFNSKIRPALHLSSLNLISISC